MAAVRSSDAVEMARYASRPRVDMEYFRRVGAYLGLSVETVISTMVARSHAARKNRAGAPAAAAPQRGFAK